MTFNILNALDRLDNWFPYEDTDITLRKSNLYSAIVVTVRVGINKYSMHISYKDMQQSNIEVLELRFDEMLERLREFNENY